MLQSDRIAIELLGRSFLIRKDDVWPGLVRIIEEGATLLIVQLDPAAPTYRVLPTLIDYIESDALDPPDLARRGQPDVEELWHPREGSGDPGAKLNLAVTIEFDDTVTDHAVHRGFRRAYWSATGEEIFLEDAVPVDLSSVADAVIESVEPELNHGECYALRLRIETPDADWSGTAFFQLPLGSAPIIYG